MAVCTDSSFLGATAEDKASVRSTRGYFGLVADELKNAAVALCMKFIRSGTKI